MATQKKIGFVTAVIAFLILISISDFDPSKPNLNIMAATAILMAILWITEAIPLAATSLIPLIFFPFTGILNAEDVATSYMNSIIFLFFGGFLIAIAMEEWSLHKRIALKILKILGGSPTSIIIGFILTGSLISMWISNTATTLMLLPIGLAVIQKLEDEFGEKKTHNLSVILLLSIAYSSTLGGIATLIGTPPNLVMVKMFTIFFPKAPEISFGSWMLVAVPISIIMLLATGILLTKVLFNVDKDVRLERNFIESEYRKLGNYSFEEKAVSTIFLVTAFLWVFRSDIDFGFLILPGWSNLVPTSEFINDGTIAVTMAFILFLIPARSDKRFLLNQESFKKVPWSIILLFGGGFALANGFSSSGLSDFVGHQLKGLSTVSPILIIIITASLVTFLSELTSNTALTQIILPIVVSFSVAIGMHPLLLMLTVTLSASMGFMLPVATPPNAIVFAGGRIKISEMAKTGFLLDVLGVIIISLLVYFLGTLIFGLDKFPEWANP